ncbi:glutaredoxin family protein [Lacisediminimonas profundi]|uniref:glutaredoxin family protein n=1 Tax=Lacisediminimonas profundi TaxID=2603856 RepID=UPI00124B8A3D|nr:glutaredoxin family protein [Lacisediminimonas profundi]
MRTIALALLVLAVPGTVSAQLYKWVGPDGKINYSDTPPPRDARNVETRPRAGEARGDVALPYALQQVAAAHPVTLYTMKNCAPCDAGRSLLASRGVPVTEKTITSNEDIAALRAIAGGNSQLPVLAVGRQRQQGYEPTAWNQLLTAAGYPAESRLPAGWRNPEPAPLVPPQQQQAEQAQQPAKAAAPPASPAPQPDAASGFRF